MVILEIPDLPSIVVTRHSQTSAYWLQTSRSFALSEDWLRRHCPAEAPRLCHMHTKQADQNGFLPMIAAFGAWQSLRCSPDAKRVLHMSMQPSQTCIVRLRDGWSATPSGQAERPPYALKEAVHASVSLNPVDPVVWNVVADRNLPAISMLLMI